MPELSRFYGITIKMYHGDHPTPHFHVEYAENRAKFSLHPLEVVKGEVPSRVRSLVLEWAAEHLDELEADWRLCQSGRVPNPIKPLD